MGGYIMRQSSWLGTGSEGSTDDKRSRAQEILQRVANLLLNTSTGWVLDPDHNLTTNPEDQTYLLDGNGGYGTYFLFFKNNNGVAPCEKLMVGYSINGYYPGTPFGYPYSATDACCRTIGLFCSMIPAGSNEIFGSDPSAEGFLKTVATKVHGSFVRSNSFQNSYTVAWRNAAATTYRAMVVTDGKTVVFRIHTYNNNVGNMWFVGPVIETLAHPSMDIASTSKILSKHFYYNTQSEAGDYYPNYTYNNFWQNITDTYNQFRSEDMFNAENKHLHSSDGHGLFFTSDSQLISNLISNSTISGFNRWVAISCGVMSPDPTTHYIVPGDGLKGYIDTNFLRRVDTSYSIGQTFDDGNFVYIGDGLAMGWDEHNGAYNT